MMVILAALVYVLMAVITEILIMKANFTESDSVAVIFAACWPTVLPMILIYLLIQKIL